MKRIFISLKNTGRERYLDAQIIKSHERSFDVQFANGELLKYVSNVTEIVFHTGDYVSVFLSEDKKTGRIIGKGKKLTSFNSTKKVRV